MELAPQHGDVNLCSCIDYNRIVPIDIVTQNICEAEILRTLKCNAMYKTQHSTA